MTAYKPHEFAKLLGVTVKTLQRWDNTGRLKANRSPSNRRYYTDEHLTPIIHVFFVLFIRLTKIQIKTDKEVISHGIGKKSNVISQSYDDEST